MSILTHTQEINNSVIEISIDRFKPTSTASKTQKFDFKFDEWVPNHLHWHAPSNLIIYSDGSWFIYAKHIANMRRTGGAFFDTGDYWTWLVNVQFFNAENSVVHANDYVLDGLNYKYEVDNATAKGIDKRFGEIESQIVRAQPTRIIR